MLRASCLQELNVIFIKLFSVFAMSIYDFMWWAIQPHKLIQLTVNWMCIPAFLLKRAKNK